MHRPLALSFVLSLTLVTPRAQSVATLVRQAEDLGARTGVVALVGDARAPLHAHRATEAFLPASNQKVLTAIGVLAGLGPDHRFRTGFRLRDGWLEVLGCGDPNWETGSADDPAVIFGQVAKRLRERGVTAVRGIRLDAGSFTGPTRPPSWPRDQLDAYYCAPTGAHVLDAGCFRARVTANGGTNARIDVLAPVPGFAASGAIKVSNAKDPVWGISEREGELVARGAIRKGASTEMRAAVHDPALWYERALRAALDAAGIASDPQAAPPDQELHVHESPLAPALARTLEDSSNFHAEQLLRVLGAQQGDGSLAGGARALREALQRFLGALPDSLRIADGSGLSRENQLTPGVLARALQGALAEPWRDVLLDSLARPGADGTLEHRFKGTALAARVRAKTGWIRGVSALSGVVTRDDGSPCVFVILMNYDPKVDGLNTKLKALQEKIVAALAADAG